MERDDDNDDNDDNNDNDDSDDSDDSDDIDDNDHNDHNDDNDDSNENDVNEGKARMMIKWWQIRWACWGPFEDLRTFWGIDNFEFFLSFYCSIILFYDHSYKFKVVLHQAYPWPTIYTACFVACGISV